MFEITYFQLISAAAVSFIFGMVPGLIIGHQGGYEAGKKGRNDY